MHYDLSEISNFFLSRSWSLQAAWSRLLRVWTVTTHVNKQAKFHFVNFSGFRDRTPNFSLRRGLVRFFYFLAEIFIFFLMSFMVIASSVVSLRAGLDSHNLC